ncbi:hypothetical protein [Variovorax sp. E3]|uniref:hypothetical protein n=1 Tax=Variovorax sp. E3 TaxID=1914993 RepID=UPI0018DC1FF8|nr:hypothetical protein [Variovorax sp. E3]
MTFNTKAAILVACVAVVAGLVYAIYELGRSDQKVESVTAITKAADVAQVKAKAKTRGDLQRAAETGHARERDRAALDALFQQLDREAKDAPTSADDHYVLPDERLRLWRAANAGRADSGAARGEPDGSASTAAAAGNRADTGPGGEPSRRSAGIPPARLADVPAAGLPADQARGL